jgi:threonine dehydratase
MPAPRSWSGEGLTFVHPFDDPQIIAGQGTVALELLEDAPGHRRAGVPVGGGGLLAGMGIAAKALRPELDVFGAQAELFPSMYCRLTGRGAAHPPATRSPRASRSRSRARSPPPSWRKWWDEILLVPERDMETAVSLFLQIEKTVAEGAGAAALAALLTHPERLRGRKVGLVLTGGNIDTRLLATGTAARSRPIRPDGAAADPAAGPARGALLRRSAVRGASDQHHRNLSPAHLHDTAGQGSLYDFDCEARDAAHLKRLVGALEANGFDVHPVEVH